MDKELRNEAIKQYLRYFAKWFIIIGVVLVIFLAFFITKRVSSKVSRGNQSAPEERVYDYADVLTTEEEEALRKLIAQKEAENKFDIVLVTVNEPMETDNVSWENAMMNYADDFYDNNNYGYNMIHGDGILLLDNWYPDQEGCWVCTTGRVMDMFSYYDIEEVQYAVNEYIEHDPYKAYEGYVKTAVRQMQGGGIGIYIGASFLISTIVALIYMLVNLRTKMGKKTVVSSTYVENGRPVMLGQSDTFVRKFVTTRHIERSSSSSGGGAGAHRSSSGVSHGGGGSRR